MGTISEKLIYLNETKTAIKNAIVGKGVAVESTDTFRSYADKIASIEVGGGAPTEKAINFYDFNGSLVQSYKLADLPLASLPTPPDHSTYKVPLTFQEWNYSLIDINATINKLNVGVVYKTTDGKTHIIATFNVVTGKQPPLYLYKYDTGTMTINWGDGTTPYTTISTGNISTSHPYADYGTYHITVDFSGAYRLGRSGTGTSSYIQLMGTNTNTAYQHCIQEVYCSEYVTDFSDYAFYSCTNLTSITIPDSVTSIGEGAFNSCTNLTSITIPDGVETIGTFAFQNCTNLTSITIPDSVTSIGNTAFQNCTNLTSITIPDSVETIGTFAFQNCSNLTSITIPDSVTSIGNSAFQNCTNLTSITIPDSVETIGTFAFSGCTNLTSITIPNGVALIDICAFQNCTNLTSITIPDSVTSIGNSAFQNCTNLTSITIPNGVALIDIYTFSGCTNLTSITIPDSVESIGNSAFQNCTNLTSITIPNGVALIDIYTFSGCTNLTSITIPDSVESIGNRAFQNCMNILEYDLTAVHTPPTLTNINAFKNINSLCIFKISNADLSAYQGDTNWSNFSNYIVGV